MVMSSKEKRARRRERGLCPRCAGEMGPTATKHLCRKCADKLNARRRTLAGPPRCSQCYLPGHTYITCPETIGDEMAGMSRDGRYKIRRTEKGLCTKCPKKLDPKVDTKWLCRKCADAHNARRRARRRQVRVICTPSGLGTSL